MEMQNRITRFLENEGIDISQYNEDAFLDLALKKAYTDMMPRTIKGHGKVGNLKTNCIDTIKPKFKTFVEKDSITKDEFDVLFYSMCEEFLKKLNNELSKNGLEKQEFGKAQKVVNMTFKYLYCFYSNEKEDLFKYCHMPIDSYILNWYYHCRIENKRHENETWSNITRGRYETILEKIRGRLQGNLLEHEFEIWENEKNNAMYKELKASLKKCNNESFKEYLDKEKKKDLSAFADLIK